MSKKTNITEKRSSSVKPISNNYYAPLIMERSNEYLATFDIFSRLLRDRIIYLNGEIDMDVAVNIQTQLLYLDSLNHKPITMFINSPGGSVHDGLLIYDTMHTIKSKVNTVCSGLAASMAAVILASGDNGCRSILPNSTVMIHQVSGFIGYEKTNNIKNEVLEIDRLNSLLANIISKHTKQPIDKVKQDILMDLYLTAEDSLEYGIVDKIRKHVDKKDDTSTK